jgi:hypothetical protein
MNILRCHHFDTPSETMTNFRHSYEHTWVKTNPARAVCSWCRPNVSNFCYYPCKTCTFLSIHKENANTTTYNILCPGKVPRHTRYNQNPNSQQVQPQITNQKTTTTTTKYPVGSSCRCCKEYPIGSPAPHRVSDRILTPLIKARKRVSDRISSKALCCWKEYPIGSQPHQSN